MREPPDEDSDTLPVIPHADGGDGRIICGPANDCECEDGPISEGFDDE